MAQNNKETENKTMPGAKSRIARAVIILILVIAALSGKQLLPGSGDTGSSATDSSYHREDVNSLSYQFRNDKYLSQHFEKHGSEFG